METLTMSKESNTSTTGLTYSKIQSILGEKAEYLLDYTAKGLPKEKLHLPTPQWVEQIFTQSDRNNRVLNNLQRLYSTGRLANTGYLSILPVDQGIEHSAGASFSPNPDFFDPETIIKLAIEGGCNAVASTYGVLSLLSRKYSHKIPMILKFNHNEFLSYPNTFSAYSYLAFS